MLGVGSFQAAFKRGCRCKFLKLHTLNTQTHTTHTTRTIYTHHSRWNDDKCHMEWARKSFHVRRSNSGQTPGQTSVKAGDGEPRGAVVGMHMYASSWTAGMSATAARMRGQAREVRAC